MSSQMTSRITFKEAALVFLDCGPPVRLFQLFQPFRLFRVEIIRNRRLHLITQKRLRFKQLTSPCFKKGQADFMEPTTPRFGVGVGMLAAIKADATHAALGAPALELASRAFHSSGNFEHELFNRRSSTFGTIQLSPFPETADISAGATIPLFRPTAQTDHSTICSRLKNYKTYFTPR